MKVDLRPIDGIEPHQPQTAIFEVDDEVGSPEFPLDMSETLCYILPVY